MTCPACNGERAVLTGHLSLYDGTPVVDPCVECYPNTPAPPPKGPSAIGRAVSDAIRIAKLRNFRPSAAQAFIQASVKPFLK